jgi:hypothetical protein
MSSSIYAQQMPFVVRYMRSVILSRCLHHNGETTNWLISRARQKVPHVHSRGNFIRPVKVFLVIRCFATETLKLSSKVT